ncbi:MAG: fibronectin type III domain-containing protein [Candidatus Nanopelagicales bacterium]
MGGDSVMVRLFGLSMGAVVAGVVAASAVGAATTVTDYRLASGAYPFAVAVDSVGNVYTANLGDGTVSKVTPEGVVTEAWAKVPMPRGIAVDSHDNVFTANAGGTVSKITAAGVVEQAWASLPGAGPYSIAIDHNDTVYTANNSTNTISKITLNGTVTQVWATLASSPQDIAVDSQGNIYTADFDASAVSKVTPEGVLTAKWAALGSSNFPHAIAVDSSDNVYTANGWNNGTISKITPAGTLTRVWATLNQDARPVDIAVDTHDNVYTANYNNETVSRVTPAGAVNEAWATLAQGSTPSRGIAVGATSAFIANPGNDTISVIPLATPPAPPTALTALLSAPTSANLSWLAPVDTGGAPIDGYVVRRFRDRSGVPEATLTLRTDATVYTDTGLNRGSAYTYSVAAVNDAGEGSASAPSKAVLPGTSPPPDNSTGVTINSGANYTNTRRASRWRSLGHQMQHSCASRTTVVSYPL